MLTAKIMIILSLRCDDHRVSPNLNLELQTELMSDVSRAADARKASQRHEQLANG
jgi:hypothetical protein